MSDENMSPASSEQHSPKTKTTNLSASGRPVKRRASKACQCCRTRKVRCNVVEHGAPCTNCRLDEVECIVTESKRRKKLYLGPKPLSTINEQSRQHQQVKGLTGAEAVANGSVNPVDISNPAFRRPSDSSGSLMDDEEQQLQHHVPHALYQCQNQKLSDPTLRRTTFDPPPPLYNLLHSASIHGDLTSNRYTSPPAPPSRSSGHHNGPLPVYIKPLPPRMTADDVHYLWKKGALSIPDTAFRNALLQAYIEFVHPYMPLIELHDFLRVVDQNNGEHGKISLVLFQAVMFAGTAFVDMSYLEAAGYPSRKAARKAFYQKARLLYDFDYEIDRVALVQSLLLMTYWYETPDDQKDTWHWMGVAISLAHTIGLHRNPEKSNMDVKKQRLWKRIWWSCFMRDRLVALGMRRPTRIKDEDFDVPMLTLEDFEIEPLAADNLTISPDCVLIRDVRMQEELAVLCIAKAKLCLIISHVLSAQYSVLVRDQGMAQGQEGNTRSSVMLFPKKLDATHEVQRCDEELTLWIAGLAAPSRYHPPTVADVDSGRASVAVQLALLHMVYFATVSALHRPQVLPPSSAATSGALRKSRELQDVSRTKVREASREITRMSLQLHLLGLERYLPTTGVTVLLPAIIIHLLDIKSCSDDTRDVALRGFCQCMAVLEKLRDNYAAADYAIQFLEAAIRKADLDLGRDGVMGGGAAWKNLQIRRAPVGTAGGANLTPPPDGTPLLEQMQAQSPFGGNAVADMSSTMQLLQHDAHAHALASAATPPGSDSSHIAIVSASDMDTLVPSSGASFGAAHNQPFDDGFDALIDYGNADGGVGVNGLGVDVDMDVTGGGLIDDWTYTLEEGVHGESGGFMMDVDWMKEGVAGAGGFDIWGTGGDGEGVGVYV